MINDTRLLFYPLIFMPDAPDVIIGRKDINSYAAFPEDGAELLKQLQAGSSVEAAAAWYQDRYQENIDMVAFLETLQDLQFLRENVEEEPPATTEQSSPLWLWFGRAVFSPYAWIIYAAIFALCLALMFRFPYLLPSYQNLFFSPYLVILELGLFFGQLPCVCIHELYHTLAGERLGISARFSIGRRLYFIVFETRLDGLWAVPRKKRYLPFLAGMIADVLLFSLFTIIAGFTYQPSHPYAFPGAFCLALAFSTLLRFVWQFYFYLQTDIYYVFCNIFHCVDLQETTQQYIWNGIYRLLGRVEKLHDEEEWHPRDKQVARWYVFFFVVGCLFSLGTFLLAGLPSAIKICVEMLPRLLYPFTTGFWDVLVFLLLNLIQIVIFATIFLREYFARRKKKRAEISAA